MKRARTDKTFDCVEMKRKAAARIYATVKSMTAEQESAYWQRVNDDFQRHQEQRLKNAPSA